MRQKKDVGGKKWPWENLKANEGDTVIFPLVLLFLLYAPRTDLSFNASVMFKSDAQQACTFNFNLNKVVRFTKRKEYYSCKTE